MTDEMLVKTASEARKSAYAPYSGFTVGAALLCSDGKVYTGCNIENGAFSPSVCAERVAIFKAVSDGKREFSKIAVTGGKTECSSPAPCPPCGVCRQVMSEFCGKDFKILLSDENGKISDYSLEEILPLSFSL